jgi:hypothetical protein
MWSPSRSILSCLLTLLGPVILFAQANYTTQLTGTVTDSSGGVVSGAKVIVTDDATNIAATVVSYIASVDGKPHIVLRQLFRNRSASQREAHARNFCTHHHRR